jgi:zinc protease
MAALLWKRSRGSSPTARWLVKMLSGLLLVAGFSFFSARAQSPDSSGSPNVDSDVPTFAKRQTLDHDVTLVELSNGLTVIVQENHSAPVATVRCYVNNTGSAFEGEYLGAGISHVLEHVVAGGTTTKRSEKEVEQLVDRIGGATNAFTSTSMTAYFIDSTREHVDTTIELVADQMQHIAFEPSEFERELKVVQQELRDGENDRRRVLWKMIYQTLYQEHPVRNPIIGYLDVLQKVKNEEIIRFYRERYVPNNQVFVVVGDVETEKILRKVAESFSGTKRGFQTYIPLVNEPRQMTPREAIREMDGSTYDLSLVWPTVELADPDLYALDVAAYILAEGESSRMVRRLQYQDQLVLSIRSLSYTPHFVNGFFGVMATCMPEKWAQAQKEILREVERLREELVSPEELAKAKKQKESELVFGQQTIQEAADSLGRNFISTGDPLFDEKYVEGIRQVTAEDVRRVARRYLTPPRRNRILIAPPDGAPQESGRNDKSETGQIRAVKLPNGVRVLVKRRANLPMVNIRAYTLGSALVDPPEKAGRSSLVASMLDKGTPDLDARQIAEYFDSIGGKLSMAGGRNTVYGSATVLADDFERSLEIFADCFLHPTFPPEEFRKVKTLALGAIARRNDNPFAELFEVFSDTLPPTTPYHIVRGGKKETVEPMTIDEVARYHRKYFVPENMLVTVFGDIDPDRALEWIEKRFGKLQPSPDFPSISFDRKNEIEQSVRRHKQTGKQTAMVMFGYPAVSLRDEKENAALTVLDAIMSGYNYPGGWLHNELRGEGLVYAVHADLLTGPAPGYFIIYAQTRPDAMEEVIGRIEANVAKAKAGEFSEEEFRRAKEMIIALHAQSNTTIGQQAEQAALDDLYGLGYKHDEKFAERINAVTLEEVIEVARKYLDKRVLVSTSPASPRQATGGETSQ